MPSKHNIDRIPRTQPNACGVPVRRKGINIALHTRYRLFGVAFPTALQVPPLDQQLHLRRWAHLHDDEPLTADSCVAHLV